MFAVKNDDGSARSARDEHPRADTTLASLGELAAVFEQMGAMPMGPKGETLDQLALEHYPDIAKINARPHRRQFVGHRRRRRR